MTFSDSTDPVLQAVRRWRAAQAAVERHGPVWVEAETAYLAGAQTPDDREAFDAARAAWDAVCEAETTALDAVYDAVPNSIEGVIAVLEVMTVAEDGLLDHESLPRALGMAVDHLREIRMRSTASAA